MSSTFNSLLNNQNISLKSVVIDNTTNLIITGLIGFIFLICIILAIFGNILVCVAILTDHHLKQLSNTLYVSLAVADLFVASFVMTLAFIDFILKKWIFSKILCNIYISMDIMCSTASILNILATAIDRYIHIHQPFQYSNIVTKYRVFFVLLLIWLVSALMSFVPIHLKWHLLGNQHSYSSNSSSSSNEFVCALSLNPSYAIISSLISFYFPCLVMVALYIKLYRFARWHMEKIKEQNREHERIKQDENVVDDAVISSNCNVHHRKMLHKKMKTDQKAAVTLGVIMGTFLVCWLPFFVLNCVEPFCKCIPGPVYIAVTWLGYFNSCLNPIIYPLFNSDFRAAYKKILLPIIVNVLCCCCTDKNHINSNHNKVLKFFSETSRDSTSQKRYFNTTNILSNNSEFISNYSLHNGVGDGLGNITFSYIDPDAQPVNSNILVSSGSNSARQRQRRKEVNRFLPVSQKFRELYSSNGTPTPTHALYDITAPSSILCPTQLHPNSHCNNSIPCTQSDYTINKNTLSIDPNVPSQRQHLNNSCSHLESVRTWENDCSKCTTTTTTIDDGMHDLAYSNNRM